MKMDPMAMIVELACKCVGCTSIALAGRFVFRKSCRLVMSLPHAVYITI